MCDLKSGDNRSLILKTEAELPQKSPRPPPLSKEGGRDRGRGNASNLSQKMLVIPAKAGIQLHTRPKKGRVREKTSSLFLLSFVIPVKTGIHWFSMFLTGARWKFKLVLKQQF